MAEAAQVRRLAGAVVKHPKRTRGFTDAYGVRVSTEVETIELDTLLDAVAGAISGASLRMFLEEDAHEHFVDDMVMRFAYEGDRKSGPWAPLHDATVDIRRALGYPGDHPINRRSDELFDFVTTHYDIDNTSTSATLTFPGDAPNEATRAKLEHAQRGTGDNPLGHGPTVPRPVLAVDETDLATLLTLLELHIIASVNTAIGGTFT